MTNYDACQYSWENANVSYGARGVCLDERLDHLPDYSDILRKDSQRRRWLEGMWPVE